METDVFLHLPDLLPGNPSPTRAYTSPKLNLLLDNAYGILNKPSA